MKFKVGDKVRIKKDLKPGSYGWVHFDELMSKYRGKQTTVKECLTCDTHDYYHLSIDDSGWSWSEDMLKPLNKTLRNVEVGDVVIHKLGSETVVLEVLTQTVLLSLPGNHAKAWEWHTFTELETNGFTLKDQEEEETVELTLEDIAKKFNVDIEKLRIKEDL